VEGRGDRYKRVRYAVEGKYHKQKHCTTFTLNSHSTLPIHPSITQKNPSFNNLSLHPKDQTNSFSHNKNAVLPPPPLRSLRSFGLCILRAIQLDYLGDAILSYRNRYWCARQAYIDAAAVYWRGDYADKFGGVGVGGCCCWWNSTCELIVFVEGRTNANLGDLDALSAST
jgi:hypothetical protein